MGDMKFFYLGKDGEVVTQQVRNRACEIKTASGLCISEKRGTRECSGCAAWYEAQREIRKSEIEAEHARTRMHRQRRARARAVLRRRKRVHDMVCTGLMYGAVVLVMLLAMLPASSAFDCGMLPGYAAAIAVPMAYIGAYAYANGEEYRAKKEREKLRKLLGKGEL